VASTVQGCVCYDGPQTNGALENNSFKSVAVHGGTFSAVKT
jgi:hypothetical protein